MEIPVFGEKHPHPGKIMGDTIALAAMCVCSSLRNRERQREQARPKPESHQMGAGQRRLVARVKSQRLARRIILETELAPAESSRCP